MATMNVKDAVGDTVAIEKPLAPGRAASSSSGPVVLSTEDKTVLDSIKTAVEAATPAGTNHIGKVQVGDGTNNAVVKAASTAPAATDPALVVAIRPDSIMDTYAEYETVAASQTDQVLGATGASGDYLASILIIPGTTGAGAVSIKDGSGSAISIFAGGGTTPLPTLAPIFIPLGIYSTGGAWKVTTLSNVTVLAVGNFT